ncbi:MAG: FAD-dependent oxidoreductase, partial [Terriglobales bacterium]
PLEMPLALRELAAASARMYPEFVHELEDESRMKIDLRDQGTLLFGDPAEMRSLASSSHLPLVDASLSSQSLDDLEPALFSEKLAGMTSLLLRERSVDPRHVTAAAIVAAKHRGIDFSSGDQVLEVEVGDGKAAGVRTNKTKFAADVVVNCAGAWSGQIHPGNFPTRPVKGQMLCVVMPQKEMVRHVIRTPQVYLIPRSDGRLLIGATQEEAGFDKRTVPATIQKLRQAAIDIVPKLAEARILEAWAGLRPGTPDGLPILGATSTPGYFVATGHFRDGILLAPVTARIMGRVIAGVGPEVDLRAFGAGRLRMNNS